MDTSVQFAAKNADGCPFGGEQAVRNGYQHPQAPAEYGWQGNPTQTRLGKDLDIHQASAAVKMRYSVFWHVT